MKILYAVLVLALIPTAALSINVRQRANISTYNRQLEYQCIEEHRDNNYEQLQACIKEKRGTSVISIGKMLNKDGSTNSDKN